MTDIDQIIAGGAGASSRADFSGLPGILDSYWAGKDQKAKNDLRDAFKDGIPTTADGQPDFGAMAKTLMQKGAIDQGISASNLDLQRQNLRFGQGQSGNIQNFEDGQPPPQSSIASPPSSNRSASAVVAPPLNRGGATPQGQGPQGSPQGDQPGSIVGMVSAAGIPDELAGPVIQQVSALTKTDPNAALNPEVSQRVQQVVQAAAQRMKAGQPQGPMSQPQAAPQQPPMQPQQPAPMQPQPSPQVVQAQPQGQPAPVTNAVTTTAGPQTPSRVDQGIAFYSGIMSDPRSPKQNVELAKSRLEALQKSNELTPLQKEYSQAILQGYKGTMQDFANEQEAGKAGATERAKADIAEQQDYIKAGKVASDRLTTLNTLSNIIGSDKNLTLGFGADTALKVKMAMKQLGIDTGDLSGAESIQKLNALLASESTKAISPRPAQFEFKTFLGNNPGLSLDKAGNERVIGIFSQLAKREVDLGRLARKNQDNWQNWDNVIENYDKSHPIFDPVTRKPITTDSIVAPGPSRVRPQAGSAQAASPPVPGARQAPDNNWYVPDPNRPGKYLKVVQ